jgi:hypothetical protein
MPSAAPAPSMTGAVSPRVALARLALEAALAMPDVVAGDAGMNGLRVTADPAAGLLRGVSVTAERDGRYAVDLELVARMVPLMRLGETVRRRVHESARRQGLADRLGIVNVEFARVVAAGEAETGALTRPLDARAAAAPRAAADDVPRTGVPPEGRPDGEGRR